MGSDRLRYLIARSRHFANFGQPAVMTALPMHAEEATQRLAEIAEILAAGLMRVRARKSSQKSPNFGESLLALPGHQSGHATPDSPEDQA